MRQDDAPDADRFAISPWCGTLLAGVMAFVAFGGVVVLLRGYPTCWLIGLFETVAHSDRRFHTRD